MKKIGCSMFIICFCIITNAQVSWQSVPVPNENIASITVNSINTVYIGTNTYGVFKSLNDGINWIDISAGLGDSSILQMQSSSDDKIFASTSSHGLYMYDGNTWVPVNNGLPSATVVVASFAKGLSGVMHMMSSTGKIYSWNSSTWTDISYNFPTLGRALATGPDGSLYAAAFASGVYKFNGANSWTIIGAAMPNNFVTRMTITSTDTIYIACNSNNVYKCASSGGNWVLINTGLPVANMNFIYSDALDRIFVGSNTAYGAIYRTTNGGSSWATVSATLFTTNFYCFAAGPSGKLYAGASGIFRSVNNGADWEDINPGLHAPKTILCFSSSKNGDLFVGTRYGTWRSRDNGNTWQLRNTGITHFTTLQILQNAAGNLICHGINTTPKGAIYRSSDNGDNWTLAAANGCDQYTKIKQHNTDTIWACSRFSGATTLSYSINNGATWLNNPLTISAIWDIDFSKDHTIFIGSESEGVSRSDNGGQTFTLGVGNTIPWYGNVIEIETDMHGVIFAGGDWWTHILWYSLPGENGDNWTQFTDPDLVISGVQDLVFDKRNNAYIAGENSGIRMAYNTVWSPTTNWITANTGLPAANSNMLELGFDTYGYLYTVCYSTYGHNAGLFKTTIAVNPPDAETYTFTGNGNWDNTANWSNNMLPPATLSGNAMIILDPPGNGECVLNVQQHINEPAIFRLMPGKKLRILNDLIISP
ncbi:MAG: hypothetical protein ABIW38_05555 [Ferruginibacter sp.]